MKTKLSNTFTLIALMIFLSGINRLKAQETVTECKVLLKEIAGKYNGPCKDGLAEGVGMASGQDIYIGSFRKGLPEGSGVYKYKDGRTFTGTWKKGMKEGKGEMKYMVNGKDSIVTGFWRKDELTGSSVSKSEDFLITNRTYIASYTFKKVDDKENMVEVTFEQYMKKAVPPYLTLTTSSGYVTKGNLSVLVKGYTLPVLINISFPVKKAEQIITCNFDFRIDKSGAYNVLIINE